MASGLMSILTFAWLLGLAQSAAVGVDWSSAPFESALGSPEGISTSLQTIYVGTTGEEDGNPLVSTAEGENTQLTGAVTATIFNTIPVISTTVAEGQSTTPGGLATGPIILPTTPTEKKGKNDTAITPGRPATASITLAVLPDIKGGNDTATATTKKPPLLQPLLGRAAKNPNPTPKPPPLLCSPDTCGSDICPISQKRFLDNSTLDLFKRGEPEKGDWRDPSDYQDNRGKFMSGEVHDAAFSSRATSKIVKPSPDELWTTTSNYIIFEDTVSSISVTGLYGCTSVIVISRRGAWVSHIWEAAFKSDDLFQEDAIGKIHKGDGDVLHPFGIDELRNQANVGPRGVIFGDNTNPNYDPDIHVFLMTPRERAAEYTLHDDGKSLSWVEDELRERLDANADKPPLYDDRMNQIRKDLQDTLGSNVPVQTIGYSPPVRTLAESREWMAAARRKDDAAIERLEMKVQNRLGDPEFKSFRGKALLQYRPASDCADKARWRLWVENRAVQGQAEWDPSSSQSFKGDDDDEIEDRRVKRVMGTTKPGDGDGDGDSLIISQTFMSLPKTTTTVPKSKPETTLKRPEPEPEPTRTPLEVFSQHCNDEDDFPDHEPVNYEDVWSGAADACQHGGTVMWPGDSWERNGDASNGGSVTKVHFRVSYIDSCETALSNQNMWDPLNLNPSGDLCRYLFYDNWGKCNNGGVGGYRDVGCLRYYTGAGPLKGLM